MPLSSLPLLPGVTEQFWWLWQENYIDHTDVATHPITGDTVYGVNKKDLAPDGKAEFNYYVVLQRAKTGERLLLHKYTSSIGPYGRSSVSIQPSGTIAVFLSASYQSDPILVGAGVSVISGVFKPYTIAEWDEARVASLEQQIAVLMTDNADLRARIRALEARPVGGLTAEQEDNLHWVSQVRAVE